MARPGQNTAWKGLYERNRLFDLPGARLTDRNISALSVDHTGKLWIGYFDRGLDILDPSSDRKVHFDLCGSGRRKELRRGAAPERPRRRASWPNFASNTGP